MSHIERAYVHLQVYKLVNVLFVENVTRYQRVERELMLLKLKVESDVARNEMLELTRVMATRNGLFMHREYEL